MASRRIYYVPGMISVIGIALLLKFFHPEPPPGQFALKVFLPSDYKINGNGLSNLFSRADILKSIRKQQILTVSVEKNERDFTQEKFNSKLQFVQDEMRRIGFSNDTSTVLKVVLGETNTLGDLVKLIDIASLADVRRWMLDGNEIYFIPKATKQTTSTIEVPLVSL